MKLIFEDSNDEIIKRLRDKWLDPPNYSRYEYSAHILCDIRIKDTNEIFTVEFDYEPDSDDYFEDEYEFEKYVNKHIDDIVKTHLEREDYDFLYDVESYNDIDIDILSIDIYVK